MLVVDDIPPSPDPWVNGNGGDDRPHADTAKQLERWARASGPSVRTQSAKVRSRPTAANHGEQYAAVRYTQRLADASAVASVGSTGDSYDNALAEAFNSLFKAEPVRNTGPRKKFTTSAFFAAELDRPQQR